MAAAGQPADAVRAFEAAWRKLVAGERGLMPESGLIPAEGIPDHGALDGHAAAGRAAMGSLAVIRLNGGLGTSMGLDGPKSLLRVRGERTFLDVIIEQVETLRRDTGVAVPLVTMDSFRTQADCAPVIARRAGFVKAQGPVPTSFVQHQVPKVLAADLSPAPSGPWPDAARWCPPGHGDIFLALRTSGTLAALRAGGFRYAFVANADNLGATPDAGILGWMQAERLPFVMEVCRRTSMDSKGGHLARERSSGRLVLREVAQCPPEDLATFQDIERHRYFNTNNLWVDLAALTQMLDENAGVLPLPLICNSKHLVPTNPESPRVYQLESAMGAAIQVFEGAAAVCVPRTRFLPVKTTTDLLRLRSDLYEDAADGSVRPAEGVRPAEVRLELDPRHFETLEAFEARFPKGVPSLRRARSLRVIGDVRFGGGVSVRGDTVVDAGAEAGMAIPDGQVIEGPEHTGTAS